MSTRYSTSSAADSNNQVKVVTAMQPVTSASSGSIHSAGDDRNNTRSAHASSDDTTSVLSNTCSASASTSSSSSSVVFDSSDCETAQQSTDRLSRVRRSAKNSSHRSRHTNQMTTNTTNNFCRESDKRSSNTATTTASSTNTTNISTRRERRSERSTMDRKSRSSRSRSSLVPIPAPSAATSSSTTTASAPRKSTSATKLPSSSSSSSIATTATAVSDAKFDKYGSARKIRKRSTSSSRNRRDLGGVSVASKSKSKSKAKADKSSRRTKDSKRTSKVVDSEAAATGSTSAAALAKSKKRSGDAKAKYRRTKTAAASPPPTATTTTTTTTATTTTTTTTAATSKAPTAEPHKVVHSSSNAHEGGSPVEPRALRTTMKTQMSAGIASSGSIHPPTTAHKDALFDVIYELVADVLSRIGVVCDVELFEFMETLAEESNSHEDTLVTAIIYIWRVHNKLPDLRVGRGDTGHALFLAALLLAWKVTYDKAYYNSSWAKIAAVAGHPFSNAHVNSMEIELLSFLNYDMHVSAADYNSVLGACSDEAANRCAERLSAEFNSFADRTHDFDGMLDTSGDSGDDWDPSNRPMPAALQRSSKCLDLSGTADSFEATTLFGKTGGSDSDVLAPTLAH